MSAALPWRVVAMVALVVATQVAGAALLARSQGFAAAGWTAACLATYAGSFWLLARVVAGGVALSLIVPVLAALVPLATVAVATLLLGESASWGRVGLLVAACGLIGLAARV